MSRVLVVDDSLTVRMDLGEAFRGAGWAATLCGSPGAAREALARERFDCLVLGAANVGLLREIGTRQAGDRLPVIVLAAETEVADVLAGLPRAADEYAGMPYDRAHVVERARQLARRAPGAAPLVLAVDDSPTYLHALADQLRQDHLEVIQAESGPQALDVLQQNPIACILADMLMPGMSGQELCRRIKDSPQWRSIPLIMLTGREDRQAVLDSFSAGADDFVPKSADLAVLRARVRAQLRRRRLEEEVHKKDLEAAEALRHRSEQLRALASELTMAEQRERQRIAQVLHDSLQQSLAAARFRLGALDRIDDLNARQEVAQVGEILSDALETARSLTAELSPPILHEGGLVPALEWLARWMLDKHGLAIDLKLPAGPIPAAKEIAVLLFQAARELAFNVVKHAGVKAVRMELAGLGDRVQLSVSDEGAGFDPASLRAVGGYGGGLGLFAIRERLDLLGGRMEIDSAVGRGSRVMLTAPLPTEPAARAAPAEPEPESPIGIAPAPAAISPGAEGRIRVVLVDDHVVVRQGLTSLLRLEPAVEIVGEASDGESAVELIRRLLPDVVLMDISMPGMNGIEATRIVHAGLPEVQIIGLSMHADADMARQMRQAGAVAYVSKSGPAEAIIAAILACGSDRGRS